MYTRNGDQLGPNLQQFIVACWPTSCAAKRTPSLPFHTSTDRKPPIRHDSFHTYVALSFHTYDCWHTDVALFEAGMVNWSATGFATAAQLIASPAPRLE